MRLRNDLGIEDHQEIATDLQEIKQMPLPPFERSQANISDIRTRAGKYDGYKNILIAAYGGSNTSFLAYHQALYKGNKNIRIINTTDPSYLNHLRKTFPSESTLLICISKSGTTAGVLETYFFFKDYHCVFITQDNGNPLQEIARQENIEVIEHPDVGGRYSGRTSSAYFPAALIGLDIEEIERGFQEIYSSCRPEIEISNNPALRMASDLYVLEKKGYTELFVPIYSHQLAGIQTLLMQLVHESSCKDRKGQTTYPAMAPEAQHHTNQRFFGGRRNVAGLFIKAGTEEDAVIQVPEKLRDVKFKTSAMKIFQGLKLSQAFAYEYEGTYRNALNKKIPCASITLSAINSRNMGKLIGFMHYFAVYSSVLRKVIPYDQPHVEDSKKITLDLIMNRFNSSS